MVGQVQEPQQEDYIRTAVPHKIDSVGVRLPPIADIETHVNDGQILQQSGKGHCFPNSFGELCLLTSGYYCLHKPQHLFDELELVRAGVFNVLDDDILVLLTILLNS